MWKAIFENPYAGKDKYPMLLFSCHSQLYIAVPPAYLLLDHVNGMRMTYLEEEVCTIDAMPEQNVMRVVMLDHRQKITTRISATSYNEKRA